jgi:hypothetical protein
LRLRDFAQRVSQGSMHAIRRYFGTYGISTIQLQNVFAKHLVEFKDLPWQLLF